MVSGLYDFTFNFNLTINQGGEPEVSDNVTILMSPQHAKALSLILEEHIIKFEESFGEIELPADFTEKIFGKK